MDVFDLQAKIGINTAEYKKGISEAGKEFSELGSKIKSGAETIAKVGVAAFTALTGAAAATTAAILKGVDAYTTYGDNVDKMSQKLNMSAKAYQEWSAIMEHCGTSIDSMQASMKTLANAVESGNEAFERLGITQEEIATMNNEQLFSRTITALQNVGNETERTYLAGQLLGRGATELGALLNTSAEDTEKMRQRVHELGGVMSDEAVKASAKYKDSLQDMKTAFKGIGKGLIADFVPALTQVSDGLTAIFSGDEKGTEMFMEGFNNALNNLSKSAGRLKPIIKKMVSVASEVIPDIVGTVGQGILKAVPSLLESGKGILKSIIEGLENSEFDVNNNLFTKVLGSIVGNAADYFDYAQQIVSNLANKILDVDYGKLATNIGTLLTSAINSITNLIDDIDWEKVGKDAADFINHIPWGDIADQAIECLETAIKNIPNLAKGFFENIDGENLMDGIAVFASIKFLKSMKTAFSSNAECQTQWTGIGSVMKTKLGDVGSQGGVSYARAFMLSAEAAIAGWKVGEKIREAEEEKYGKENTYDVYGKIGWNTVSPVAGAYIGIKEAITKVKDYIDKDKTFTYMGKDGKEHQAYVFDKDGNFSAAYTKAGEQHNIKGVYDDYGAIPKYGDGGRVTRPTLAFIGEKEPETIVPDSKKDKFGTTNITNSFHFTINGVYNAEDPESRQLLAEAISKEMEILRIKNQRAMGGAAW